MTNSGYSNQIAKEIRLLHGLYLEYGTGPFFHESTDLLSKLESLQYVRSRDFGRGLREYVITQLGLRSLATYRASSAHHSPVGLPHF